MGFDNRRVRVNRSYESKYVAEKNKTSTRFEEYQHLIRTIKKLNDRHSKDGMVFKVFRVGSKFCPVKIDWREIVDMRKN